GIAVLQVGGAGNVQDADDLAVRIAYGSAVAAQDAVAGQVVLLSVYAYGLAGHQRRAYGIGAAVVFGPADAGAQGDPVGALQEMRVAGLLQHGSLGVA